MLACLISFGSMIGFRFCFYCSILCPPSLPSSSPAWSSPVLHLCLIVSTPTLLFIGPPSSPFCARSSGLCTVDLLCDSVWLTPQHWVAAFSRHRRRSRSFVSVCRHVAEMCQAWGRGKDLRWHFKEDALCLIVLSSVSGQPPLIPNPSHQGKWWESTLTRAPVHHRAHSRLVVHYLVQKRVCYSESRWLHFFVQMRHTGLRLWGRWGRSFSAATDGV